VSVTRAASEAERKAMERLVRAERAACEAREQLLAVIRREALRERTVQQARSSPPDGRQPAA